MSEYKCVKIRVNSYDLARKEAEKQKIPIMDLISRAIETYVTKRKDLEDRARLVIKLLDEQEKVK